MPESKGAERGSVRQGEGTEPDDEKALNEVQSNYSGELPEGNQGGVGSRLHQGSDLPGDDPPPGPPVDIEAEVVWITKLHRETCGLSSVPPAAIVRVLLERGVSPSVIDDVYQFHGGDRQPYRQRNIVEALKDIRDGRERDPPGGRRQQRRVSAAEERQNSTVAAARAFAEGG